MEYVGSVRQAMIVIKVKFVMTRMCAMQNVDLTKTARILTPVNLIVTKMLIQEIDVLNVAQLFPYVPGVVFATISTVYQAAQVIMIALPLYQYVTLMEIINV